MATLNSMSLFYQFKILISNFAFLFVFKLFYKKLLERIIYIGVEVVRQIHLLATFIKNDHSKVVIVIEI